MDACWSVEWCRGTGCPELRDTGLTEPESRRIYKLLWLAVLQKRPGMYIRLLQNGEVVQSEGSERDG